MDSFSNNIKTLRECLKLTQTEFGNRLGKRYNTIQNWEKCRAVPDLTTFEHICSVFNVSSSWLRTGEGEMFLNDGREVSPLVNDIIKKIGKLDNDNLNRLAGYIDSLQPLDNASKNYGGGR